MSVVNRYVFRARISEAKFRKIIKLFTYDLSATQIAQIVHISRPTINRYLMAIRERVAAICEAESPFSGVVEVDESYFGPRRVKGKRGRGAGGKTIVFGMFNRNGKVYTEIVPDVSKKTLQAIIRGRVSQESIVHSDTWRGYNGLVDLGYNKHYRVRHGMDEFATDKSHINGIESFWGYAKTRLSRFKGIHKHTFYLHLKETEFRFNHRNERDDLYMILHWCRVKDFNYAYNLL